MSERGSFVTEYIYNDIDYEIMKEAFGKNSGKYLCCSESPYYFLNNEKLIMPIVAGKVGGTYLNEEPYLIEAAISDVKTEYDIRIVVLTDAGKEFLVLKKSNGEVDVVSLDRRMEDNGIV